MNKDMISDSWIPQFTYLQFPNVEKWNPRTSSDNQSSCKLNFFCVANNETIICSPGPGCQSNASVRTRAKPSPGHCSTAGWPLPSTENAVLQWECFPTAVSALLRALIWYWDHLKNFITEIPQGPLGMSIGTIWVSQKRSQGPPARGFWLF